MGELIVELDRTIGGQEENLQGALTEGAEVRTELLSGEQEAALAFAGATQGRDPSAGPFVTLDVSASLRTGDEAGPLKGLVGALSNMAPRIVLTLGVSSTKVDTVPPVEIPDIPVPDTGSETPADTGTDSGVVDGGGTSGTGTDGGVSTPGGDAPGAAAGEELIAPFALLCQAKALSDLTVEIHELPLLVPPRDAPALAAAARSVLCDPALARTLRARGEARVARWDWPVLADRWEALPKPLRSEPAGPAIVARSLGPHGDVTSITYEYGTTFTLTAGLMNLLLVLDVFDIAQGRKK